MASPSASGTRVAEDKADGEAASSDVVCISISVVASFSDVDKVVRSSTVVVVVVEYSSELVPSSSLTPSSVSVVDVADVVVSGSVLVVEVVSSLVVDILGITNVGSSVGRPIRFET